MRSEVQRLPAEFLERLRKIIPPQKWDEIANTFTEPRPTTFRVNTLKREEGRGSVQERLEHQGFRLERWGQSLESGTVPVYRAFILRSGRLRDLQETDIYKKGEVYVQSLSSMLPPLVLNPQPGERILDLTAAPGSKTTQLACLMKGEGEIVANDNNQIRFFKLKANVESQGAKNVRVSMKSGELFGRDYPENFDRVLVDAPCSAEGRFLVTEPASYKYWKPAKVKEMARKQKNLVLSGFRALKPGGTLVYSTCTFAPEENEEVLDWLMEKIRDGPGGHLSPIPELSLRTVPNQTAGFTQWNGKSLAPSINNARRILPTPLMEAFFIAKVLKAK